MEENKGGRPRKQIQKESFEKLCGMQCTEAEICGFFGTTDKTLSRWCEDTYGEGFSDTYKKLSQDGKISLRRAQFRLAEKSPAMAIFLGKNYLGQSDKMVVENPNMESSVEQIAKMLLNGGDKDE